MENLGYPCVTSVGLDVQRGAGPNTHSAYPSPSGGARDLTRVT